MSDGETREPTEEQLAAVEAAHAEGALDPFEAEGGEAS